MRPFWRAFLLLLLLVNASALQAQNTITGNNGYVVPATVIPGDPQCVYEWKNDNPAIGLPASGIGNKIPSFTAVNNGSKSVTAHITATPLPSGYAYINLAQEGEVAVVSVASQEVVAKIPVGALPGAIDISADGSKVYVGNYSSGTLSIINTLDNTLTRTIDLGSLRPSRIQLSKDESRLYILAPGGLFTLDLSSATIIQTLWFNMAGPVGILRSRDGSKIWVLFHHSSRYAVVEVESATLTIKKIIDLNTLTADMCETIDGKGLYILGLRNDLLLMNTATYEITTHSTTAENRKMHMSKDGKLLYISHGFENRVSIMDTERYDILKSFRLPMRMEVGLIEATRDGRYIFVLGTLINREAAIIDVNTGAVTFLPVGNYPSSSGHFIKGGVDCEPSSFTVTIKPTPTAIINNNNMLTALNTVYGTPSATGSFTVSGVNITTEGILVTPPDGFEVSLNSSIFSKTVTVPGTGNLTPVTVYIRLAAKTHVGTYAGDVILSNDNALDGHVPVPPGTVIKADLKITAKDITAIYGEKPVFAFDYAGFVNGEGPAQLLALPTANTTAGQYSLPGVYK